VLVPFVEGDGFVVLVGIDEAVPLAPFPGLGVGVLGEPATRFKRVR